MELISRKEASEKGLTRFFTGKPCKRGHIAERSTTGGMCKDCEKLRDANRLEYKRNKNKERYATNPEFRELVKIRSAIQYVNYSTRPEVKEHRAAYYEKTKIHQINKAVNNYKANKEARNKAQYERIKANPIKHICRILVQSTLKRIKQNKEARTFDLLGYSSEEFKSHIEKQFKEGMSWSNHGEWHVDHKKPVYLMIKEGITDLKVINALTNLQPLWATENLSKQGKYNGEY